VAPIIRGRARDFESLTPEVLLLLSPPGNTQYAATDRRITGRRPIYLS